jgi:hypothetical protein
MQISIYLRPNIHQNGPEILGVNISKEMWFYMWQNGARFHSLNIYFSNFSENTINLPC